MARVVILGQDGVGKRTLLDKLVGYYPRAAGDADAPAAYTVNYLSSDFLASDREWQRQIWKSAWHNVRNRIEQDASQFIFVSLEGYFFSSNECVSVVDLGDLLSIEPDIIVVLIDDIYDVALRLRMRSYLSEQPRLADLLILRRLEVELGRWLCQFSTASRPKPRFYTVGVKHPLSLFVALLMRQHPPVLYLSFPISQARTSAAFLAEIQEHRGIISRDFLSFDPLTIDERRFLPNKYDPPTGLAARWPIEPLMPAVPIQSSVVSFSSGELQEAKPLILGDLRWRAYNYVFQADLIAVYRPFWEKPAGHRGVLGEMTLARSLGKYMISFDPDEDASSHRRSCFGDKYSGIASRREFYSSITNLMARSK